MAIFNGSAVTYAKTEARTFNNKCLTITVYFPFARFLLKRQNCTNEINFFIEVSKALNKESNISF